MAGPRTSFAARETAGAIEIVDGKPRKRAKGRVDYTLRVALNPEIQPVAVALIEAKAENLPPILALSRVSSTPPAIG